MFQVRVHASIAGEAQQMQVARAAALHGLHQQRLAGKFTVCDQQVNARDVHMNDAARAHIHVAHFAVAHLAFGQSHGWPRSLNQRVGKIF